MYDIISIQQDKFKELSISYEKLLKQVATFKEEHGAPDTFTSSLAVVNANIKDLQILIEDLTETFSCCLKLQKGDFSLFQSKLDEIKKRKELFNKLLVIHNCMNL